MSQPLPSQFGASQMPQDAVKSERLQTGLPI